MNPNIWTKFFFTPFIFQISTNVPRVPTVVTYTLLVPTPLGLTLANVTMVTEEMENHVSVSGNISFLYFRGRPFLLARHPGLEFFREI